MIEYLDINRRNQQKGILSQKGIFTLPKSRSLLLDSYPAKAAYSLFKLSSSYTGAAVNVRRSSDNTTLDIGFDGADLDIAALEDFCLNTDGYVTTWYDITGNGYNATQTLAASQPQIVSSGSIITEFGKVAIDFDGNDDWLNANMTNSEYSQLFVVKNTIHDSSVSFSGAAGLFDNRYDTTTDDITFSGFDGLFVVDNQNIKGYRNGIDETGSAISFTQLFNRLYFGSINGSSSFGEGTMQLIVLYDNDQSSNKTEIEKIINKHYNIY